MGGDHGTGETLYGWTILPFAALLRRSWTSSLVSFSLPPTLELIADETGKPIKRATFGGAGMVWKPRSAGAFGVEFALGESDRTIKADFSAWLHAFVFTLFLYDSQSRRE